jgi:hypothetical protein
METKDISIQKYMAFITTVECGSFTKAGREAALFPVRGSAA